VTPRRSPWWVILVVALIVATLGITAAATLLSFLAFRSLAELVGWDPATAWLVQPVVELFVLAGAAELAMRTWERRPDRSLPEVLIYTALVVSIAVNVSSHVLANVAVRALWWHTAVIGVMAAFVPLAQVGGVFLLTDRLRALGDRRAVGEVAVVREEVTDAGGSDTPVPGPPVHDPLFLAAQAVASHLEDGLTRRALIAGLRERGHQVSTTRASELLKQLRDAA
jgi:hypothetical protein